MTGHRATPTRLNVAPAERVALAAAAAVVAVSREHAKQSAYLAVCGDVIGCLADGDAAGASRGLSRLAEAAAAERAGASRGGRVRLKKAGPSLWRSADGRFEVESSTKRLPPRVRGLRGRKATLYKAYEIAGDGRRREVCSANSYHGIVYGIGQRTPEPGVAQPKGEEAKSTTPR